MGISKIASDTWAIEKILIPNAKEFVTVEKYMIATAEYNLKAEKKLNHDNSCMLREIVGSVIQFSQFIHDHVWYHRG